MKILLITLSSLLAAGMVSCNKDKENPTILITSPENHQEYHAGDMIHATAAFNDDQGLKSYDIYIGDEDGGHVHAWHYSDANTIEGTIHEWEGHLTVPDSLPEMLFLHFEVTDMENKTSTDKVMMHFH